ncbi:MAG: hypothetical protein ACFFHD_12120 [Promethearchaeota archaeon]
MKKPQIYKICVFGENGVGKSTLLSKYFKETDNKSLGAHPKLTLGVTFYQNTLKIDDVDILLHVWELTGEEKFKDLRIKKTKRDGKLKKPRPYFEPFTVGAKGAIFVYDITDKSSLVDLDWWLKLFKKTKRNVSIPILMVGTKADLQDERKISLKLANKLASARNLIGAIEISSEKEKEIGDLFNNFAKIIKRVYPKRQFVDVFRNELDLRIFLLLKIYKELSLKEMSYHTGKSKAQLSRRTRDLVQLGLIESYSKEDEVQPGNIKRKYYKLSKNFDLLMEKKEFNLEKAIKDNNWEPLLANIPKFSYEYKKLKMISDHINNYLEATESHLLTSVAMEDLPMIDIINVLMEALEKNLIHYHFISEKQYEKVKALSLEFNSKLEEILKKDDSSVKPCLYMDILLNILGIVKHGTKSGSYILRLRQPVKNTKNSI